MRSDFVGLWFLLEVLLDERNAFDEVEKEIFDELNVNKEKILLPKIIC